MSEVVKGRFVLKDEIKTLELKKDNLKDKVEMQKNFIKRLKILVRRYCSQRKKHIQEICK